MLLVIRSFLEIDTRHEGALYIRLGKRDWWIDFTR
jgi:hypothetical protein